MKFGWYHYLFSVIDALQSNHNPFRTSFGGGERLPLNYFTGEYYDTLDAFVLNAFAHLSPHWVSKAQLDQCKIKLPLEERASSIKTDKNELLFNVTPKIRLNPKEAAKPSRNLPKANRNLILAQASKLSKIEWNTRKAGYDAKMNTIHLPWAQYHQYNALNFEKLFHQMIHATGHYSHLGRFDKLGRLKKNFMPNILEQITADMGASLLCAYTGVTAVDFGDSKYKFEQYLKVAITQPEKLASSAAEADRAVNYILQKSHNRKFPKSRRVGKRLGAYHGNI